MRGSWCSTSDYLPQDRFLSLPHFGLDALGAFGVVVSEDVERTMDGESRELLAVRDPVRLRLPQRLVPADVDVSQRRLARAVEGEGDHVGRPLVREVALVEPGDAFIVQEGDRDLAVADAVGLERLYL